ncbi:hypothetical protein D3C85_1879670 [compost metagenome]
MAAPEIDLVTGAEVGVEVIHRLVAAVGVELAVAIASQQFLPIGIQRGIDFRQQ